MRRSASSRRTVSSGCRVAPAASLASLASTSLSSLPVRLVAFVLERRGPSGLTLGVDDRLVARIFGDEELLDERVHLCARLHVIVAPAPGGNCALTGLRNQLGEIL